MEDHKKEDAVQQNPAGVQPASTEETVKISREEHALRVREDNAAAETKKRGAGRRRSRPGGGVRQEDSEDSTVAAGAAPLAEFVEKVIAINRVTKVTKGGKKLSFSALVVVGDMKGQVGFSLEKAKEVSMAIRKALNVAKKNMVKIPLRGTTITHEIIGECGGSRVLLKPATPGTGVIAAGAVRAVCDGAGIRDILTKCHRSSNPINVVKATMDGLTRLKSAQNS